ncbi:MAG: tetratricopeptide repeat protein [Oleiphilus sp.]
MLNKCFRLSIYLLAMSFLVACGGAPKKPAIVIEKTVANDKPVLTELDKANYQKAVQLLSQAELDKAESLFTQLVDAHPKLTGAYVNLGVIKKAQNQSEDAKSWFSRALEIDPNFIDALLQQALIMQDAGKFTEAEDLLRRAEAINPKHPLVQYNLGVLYELYLQEYSLAIKHYEQYVQLSSADDVETVKRWIMLLERK